VTSSPGSGDREGVAPAEASPRPSGFLRENRELFVHWLLFLVILGATIAIDQWAFRWINTTLAEWTAAGTAWTLRLFGVHARSQGITMTASSLCYFEIIGECTAYYPCAIFFAAVTAFPARIVRKLLGLLLGLPAILLINQLRLASLCYIAYLWPDLYDALHMVVWQALMIVVTVLLWLLWATTLAGGHEAQAT
jgi:exosortase/archaeosortase family protein